MREITIQLTEEDEKNLCKLLGYRNAQLRELLGPDYPRWTQESLLYACATLAIEQRLNIYE